MSAPTNWGQIRNVSYFRSYGVGDLWDFFSGCRRCFAVGLGFNDGDVVGFELTGNGNAANLQPAIGIPILVKAGHMRYGSIAGISEYVLKSSLTEQQLNKIQSIYAANTPGGVL